MEFPLSKFRILDMTSDICGPYLTKLFADAGAEVVKIESPEGDPMRARTFFHFLNTSKKSVVLDIETKSGRRDFLSLVRGADMVVEDFEAGYLEKLGLEPNILRAENPGLVVASISPWGKEGPFKNYPANEFTLQAWVGAIFYRGIPGETPYGVGGQLGDFMTASAGASAALGALLSAEQTGVGHHLDISKFEAMLTSFVTHHHILEAFDPGGTHMSGRSIEIPSIEPTGDGWVGFCTITGQQFQDFCVLIGDPELGEDERFANFDKRMEFREEVWERIAKYTSEHTTQEITESATLLRIPVAPIGNGKNVLENDHFLERGIYQDNPAGFSQPRVPYLAEKITPKEFELAPDLGEHTAEVFTNFANAESKPSSPPVPQTPTPKPLEGVRVCDLSAFWAGPLAASFLGSLGAEVIKVESPKRPDGMRFAGSTGQEKIWEWSPVFHGANCNKYDLALDITADEGMAILKKLISTSDLVIENYSPRVMENWGLTWDVVKELNPDIIMLRLPAFGLTGPWRDRTGFAMTIEQASGLAFRTGDPNGRPMVPRGVCDPLGAMHAVFAALLGFSQSGILAGEKTHTEASVGQLIEVPLVEAGLNAASEQVVEWSANEKLLTRLGNRSDYIAPQGVYPCKSQNEKDMSDEWICISVDDGSLWSKLVQILGDPELAKDKSLENLEARMAQHDRIDSAITAWTKTQDMDIALKALTDLGIPAAPVITGRESNDHPQLVDRGFHQKLQHPVAGEVPYTSFPVRFDGRYLEFKSPAPTLGQHNHFVLTEILGLEPNEVEELEEKGIIGTKPNF